MIKRGDIYWVNFGVQKGSEQSGLRPAVIVQNDVGNKYSPITLVCPMTSKVKKQMPTHVVLNPEDCGIEKLSTVLCEQSRIIDKSRLLDKFGEITEPNIIEDINEKIMISFGLVEVKRVMQ